MKPEKRKIMILGAGIYQVPLIRKARQMGLYTICVSYKGAYPGFKEADESLFINTADSEKVLAEARRAGISGALTTGTDVAVRTIGRINDELGLAGISEEAAIRLTDKIMMKKAFAGNVSTSGWRTVSSPDEAVSAAEGLGYPVMVKAVRRSGSRGIIKARGPEEMEKAFAEASLESGPGDIIVERFEEGTEIGLDAFISGGEVVLFMPHTKYTAAAGNVTIPAGHAFPLEAPPEIRRKIGDAHIKELLYKELLGIIKASGADNCAINADIIIKPDGSISVIEAGGRMGATCIPELISIYTGVDIYKQMILSALGEKCSFDHDEASARPCAAKLIFSEKSGTVRSIDTERIEQLKDMCGADIMLDISAGDQVSRIKNGTSRIGHVILRGGADEKMGGAPESMGRRLDEIILSVRECIDIDGSEDYIG